ncbi:heavy metal-binding domain-containing protein [Erythrobacter longus]|uniref:heavy metal-binding domain-containing protein n=1 Tax=Erythrobacter longus TaxID=1044 RepID=UPI003BAB1BB1
MQPCSIPIAITRPAVSVQRFNRPVNNQHYRHEKHEGCDVRQVSPGSCPICGMALVPQSAALALDEHKAVVGCSHSS